MSIRTIGKVSLFVVLLASASVAGSSYYTWDYIGGTKHTILPGTNCQDDIHTDVNGWTGTTYDVYETRCKFQKDGTTCTGWNDLTCETGLLPNTFFSSTHDHTHTHSPFPAPTHVYTHRVLGRWTGYNWYQDAIKQLTVEHNQLRQW